MPEFLVTGAAGFVGSNLASQLVSDSHTVRGVDSLVTGREQNLASLRGSDRFEFVEGDICDPGLVKEVVEDVDYVLLEAAIPSVPRSITDPRTTTEANCVGTTNLLWFAKEAGVEKVVVASSSSVYGPRDEATKHEEMCPNPVSPYALSKFWTERLAVQFDAYYDIKTIALRYFNVFGPRQDPDSEYAAVVPTFIERMHRGDHPIVYGDGEQTRDFTHIDNVVSANRKAIECDCSGEVLNVGCNDSYSLNTLIDILTDLLDTSVTPEYTDPRPGDVRHSRASIEKAQEMIGYEPVVGFREGLRRTVEHFVEEA
jgi:nucleoside-diphosphate-sugar epimerase